MHTPATTLARPSPRSLSHASPLSLSHASPTHRPFDFLVHLAHFRTHKCTICGRVHLFCSGQLGPLSAFSSASANQPSPSKQQP
eukprot:1148593-Pleurochrysis_carterae.AAC.2